MNKLQPISHASGETWKCFKDWEYDKDTFSSLLFNIIMVVLARPIKQKKNIFKNPTQIRKETVGAR